MNYTAKAIAEILSGKVIGNPNTKVNTISKIQEAKKGALSFLANPIYEAFLYSTEASIVLINQEYVPEKKIKPTLIVVEDSYKAFATLVDIYQKVNSIDLVGVEKNSYIHKNAIIGNDTYVAAFAYISNNAVIADNVKIFPHVFVGESVTIGEGTVLHSGVKIYNNCKIGKNCIIHSGTVIGSDGFGFAPQKDGSYIKIQQIGNVIIGDDVEIGANTTIDRATLGSTLINSGVKLDNLIQIAHNVEIDENTVIAAQAGIAGSTKIGKNCLIGGQAGFVGHIKVADKTNVGAQAGIVKSITQQNLTYLGSPAYELQKFHRSYVVFKNLPDYKDKILELQKEINELKEQLKSQKI